MSPNLSPDLKKIWENNERMFREVMEALHKLNMTLAKTEVEKQGVRDWWVRAYRSRVLR